MEKTPKILIVEDESIVAKDIEKMLQKVGYEIVAIVNSGEDAIERASEARPDLVMMDINLKGAMDGVQAAERIHAQLDIPIIYLTAYSDEKTLKRAKITSPFGYVLKPFDVRELHSTIEMGLYRHKIEKKLRERERWLATTLNSIGDAVIATDMEGYLVFMNPVAEKLTGWKKEKGRKNKLLDIVNITDGKTDEAIDDPISKVLREGTTIGLADQVMCASGNGKKIPIDLNVAPIRDEKEYITGAVLVFQDITDRKEAEKQLVKQEEKFRSLFEEANDAIFIQTKEGEIAAANKKACALLGYSMKELVALSMQDIFPPNFAPLLPRYMHENSLKKGVRFEAVNVHKDGRLIPVEVSASYSGKGRERRILTFVRDITDRKDAEEKIRQQRTYLQALIEHTPLAVVAIDLNGDITTCNPAFERLFQYSREEAITKPLDSLVAFHDQVQEANKITQKVVNGGRVHVVTVRSRKDGTLVDVEIFGVPVMIRGKRIGAFAIYQDITERKRAQEALQKSEEQYRSLQANVPIGLFRTTPDNEGRYRSANPTCVSILGYDSFDELAQVKVIDTYVNVKDRALFRKRLLIEGSVDGMELQLRRKDGSHFWARISASLVSDRKGKALSIDGILEDVTEFKRMESDREERLRRTQVLSKIALQLIRATDIKQILNLISECALQLLNCRVAAVGVLDDKKEKIAHTALSKHPKVTENYSAQLLLTGNNGFYQPIHEKKHITMRINALDEAQKKNLAGGKSLEKLLATALVGANDTVNGLIVVADPLESVEFRKEDEFYITLLAHYATVALSRTLNMIALKKARSELSERAKALARSNADLEQFAYVASHDLQEPLRMVSSYMQLLERRYKNKLDADADEFIGYAVDGANRMQRLIRDLLQYSRVATRGKPFKSTDTSKIMQQVIKDLQCPIEESNAEIECKALPTVLGDESQLGQLFQNLVSNAIKYRDEKSPEIKVSAARINGNWRFSVKDNGIGIDQKFADKIFVIFQRLHGNTEYSGTGIGLAVCKKIVERHGGRIWVESKVGEGSTFNFEIPA